MPTCLCRRQGLEDQLLDLRERDFPLRRVHDQEIQGISLRHLSSMRGELQEAFGGARIGLSPLSIVACPAAIKSERPKRVITGQFKTLGINGEASQRRMIRFVLCLRKQEDEANRQKWYDCKSRENRPDAIDVCQCSCQRGYHSPCPKSQTHHDA